MVQAHANPKMLRWGRETAGYSVDEVVAEIGQKGVTAETVESWENGDSLMSYAQLKKLANFYKRPVAIFYAPKPRWPEKIETDFRSLPQQYLQRIPPSVRFAIRNAHVKQLNLMELQGAVSPLPALFDKVPDNMNVQEIAKDVRKKLAISFAEQKRWADAGEAFRKWRKAVENLGLWVFQEPFKGKGEDKRQEDYDGFYLPDKHFPVIYLNSKKPPTRKIFTLFHELGHSLLREGGICFRRDLEHELQGEFQAKEIFCNAFAGEFLLSDDEFSVTEMLTDEDIASYASKYKVSWELILRKCKGKGLISSRQYSAKVNQWKEMAKQKEEFKKIEKSDREGGPSYYLTQKAHLGEKFLKLAFSQYHQNRISESELANYLGVKEKNLPKLESEVYK